jgi:hypothetical protein
MKDQRQIFQPITGVDLVWKISQSIFAVRALIETLETNVPQESASFLPHDSGLESQV